MQQLFKIVFFLGIAFHQTLAAFSEETYINRIQLHFVIKNYTDAILDIQEGLKNFPNSKTLRELHIKALARSGQEDAMRNAWEDYALRYPDQYEKEILEEMAWGILQNGSKSTAPATCAMGILGSFLSQDIRGIAVLVTSMRHQNSLIRALTVELASYLRDDQLKDEIKRLFYEEKDWKTHQLVIQALGKMKMKEFYPVLKEIISSDQSTAEEKETAILSIAQIIDTISREEMLSLAQSERFGLRLLACELMIRLNLNHFDDIALKLVQDRHPEVRSIALQTVGFFRIRETPEGVPVKNIAYTSTLNDLNDFAAISAAWLLTVSDSAYSTIAFEKWIHSTNKDVCRLASGALAATGKHGVEAMKKFLYEAQDPYVRINLALGLIKQRLCLEEAAQVLFEALSLTEKWAWRSYGIFKYLAPGRAKENGSVVNSPEIENQLIRLEILNILSILENPNALKGLQQFLSQKNWHISGAAVNLLLSEGDEASFKLIRSLLNQHDQKIRIHAALALAMWGRDEEALQVLQREYPHANREMKEKILEGIARVHSKASIPFLLWTFNEPFQSLRIIAAFALLQCLNG